MKKLFTFGAIAVLLAACGGQSGSPAASGESAMPPAGAKGAISEERSTAFKTFMPTFSSIRKMANGDEAFQADVMKAKAAQFAQEARVPFEHFQSDPQGNGDALPNIWQKPAEFKAEQDKFLAAVDKLNAAAQTGKLDDIKASADAVGASCQSCHDTYRAPK